MLRDLLRRPQTANVEFLTVRDGQNDDLTQLFKLILG